MTRSIKGHVIRLDRRSTTAYNALISMDSRRRKRLVLAALLALACGNACGNKAVTGVSGKVSPTVTSGLAGMPAEASIVLVATPARLAAAPLVEHILERLFARDPGPLQSVRALLARCAIDPTKDIQSVTLASGPGEDLAAVVVGKLDDAAVGTCLKSAAAEAGATLTAIDKTVHFQLTRQGKPDLFLSFGAEGAVFATSQPWLRKVLDTTTPRATTRADLTALAARTDTTAAAWGVGLVPPAVGQRLVEMTKGLVTKPARGIVVELDAGKGAALRVAIRAELETDADAAALTDYARTQLQLVVTGAAKLGLADLASAVKVEQQEKIVSVSVSVDEAQAKKIEEALQASRVTQP
jgi:hypothetical protein